MKRCILAIILPQWDEKPQVPNLGFRYIIFVTS